MKIILSQEDIYFACARYVQEQYANGRRAKVKSNLKVAETDENLVITMEVELQIKGKDY